MPVSPTSSHLSQPSRSSTNVSEPLSELTTHSSIESYEHSATSSIDTDDWFAQFREDLDIPDEPPKLEELEYASTLHVYDAQGNSRPFSSFYKGLDAIGDRQLILFVRHFYCGACQSYLKALSESITMQTYYTMRVPTSIIVIGCGSPALIPHYKTVTECPFPIFADPTRKLFKALGMGWTVNIGTRRPEYMKEVSPPAWLAEQFRQMGKTKGHKKFKGGNWLQIGGEFLFEDEKIKWCHRMKNYRGHAEIETLRRILEIDYQ